MSPRAVLFWVVVPPLAMSLVSSHHPPRLTAEDARHWEHMHVAMILVFPLLALGPVLVARLVDPVSAWVVAAPAYLFATAYTALDILAGVAAGALKDAGADGLGVVFRTARPFEQVGGIAFVVACALGAGVALRRAGWLGLLPAALVVVAAVMLWREHIYTPWGPVEGGLLAVGWGALAWLVRRQGAPGPVAAPEPG